MKIEEVAGFESKKCRGNIGPFAAFLAKLVRDRLTGSPLQAIPQSWTRPQTLTDPGRPRVQVLYKRPEIPAITANLAIAISVTCRKQEKVANTHSIPVSATKSFKINHSQERRTGLPWAFAADLQEELGPLAYRNPDGGEWETADQYLSGNVRRLRRLRSA